MAERVNAPRGMRDFLPVEKSRRDALLARIVASYSAHGFTPIETPVMEDLSRLTSGMGGDNEKLAFRVLRRGLHHDDLVAAAAADDPNLLADLGLRYDLTVPLARYYASHHAELPGVFRSIQVAPVWRAERPQKGRFRQFVQCDIDIIGEAGNLAEIELIAATTRTLAELGLTGFEIRINDRRILDAILESCGFERSDWPGILISIDKLDKIGADGVIEEVRDDREGSPAAVDALAGFLTAVAATDATALVGDRVDETILTALGPIAAEPSTGLADAAANLAVIASAVSSLPGAPSLVFDPTLVRGMGYYTGTIFEVAHPGSTSSVGGGGRYDGMIGRFLGAAVPACGFSIGFERIVDLLPNVDAGRGGIVLLYEAGTDAGRLVALQAAFVTAGERVRLERRPKKTANLLATMAALGFDRFAFVGDSVDSADLEVRPLA